MFPNNVRCIRTGGRLYILKGKRLKIVRVVSIISAISFFALLIISPLLSGKKKEHVDYTPLWVIVGTGYIVAVLFTVFRYYFRDKDYCFEKKRNKIVVNGKAFEEEYIESLVMLEVPTYLGAKYYTLTLKTQNGKFILFYNVTKDCAYAIAKELRDFLNLNLFEKNSLGPII